MYYTLLGCRNQRKLQVLVCINVTVQGSKTSTQGSGFDFKMFAIFTVQ